MYYAAGYILLMFCCCATPIASLLGLFMIKWLTLGAQPRVGPAKIIVLLMFMIALCCGMSSFLPFLL